MRSKSLEERIPVTLRGHALDSSKVVELTVLVDSNAACRVAQCGEFADAGKYFLYPEQIMQFRINGKQIDDFDPSKVTVISAACSALGQKIETGDSIFYAYDNRIFHFYVIKPEDNIERIRACVKRYDFK